MVGALGAAVAFPAGAQTFLGAQFQVNSTATGSQSYPEVATDSDGDFVVVWVSSVSAGSDTSSQSVQAQRYARTGARQGSEFQVNSYTQGYQGEVSVAMDAAGNFVVVWYSEGSSGTDTSGSSIQGQRYAANGSALGAEFQVNTYTSDLQYDPAVAMNAGGDFVVVWASIGSPGTDASGASIQGQRFAANGTPQGAQFQVNGTTEGYQFRPGVALAGDGRFVVAWASDRPEFANYFDIQGQRFDANATPTGGEFPVSSIPDGSHTDPRVAMRADGSFVVVWQKEVRTGPPFAHSFFSNNIQRFASDGSPLGPRIEPAIANAGPAVAIDASIDFYVASYGYCPFVPIFPPPPCNAVIRLYHYASDGTLLGGPLQVNSVTANSGDSASARVAADATGKLIVVWGSDASAGNDSFRSVQGQRLSEPTQVPAASPRAKAMLVLSLLLGGWLALRPRASDSAGARAAAALRCTPLPPQHPHARRCER